MPTVNTEVIPMPVPKVEELRDDGHSSSCYSEEEGVLSHGEGAGSDRDGGDELSRSPQANMDEFVPPDEELREKIIKQVEFYFSDVNILKDAFLLKHVRRNKQGYVSVKLITSFRKMKSLTKDYRVVAHSLRMSEELEVNEEGSKVRRVKALPEYDETTPSRTVVAVNLPIENPTIEDVAELFKECGEITLIRVLRPGKTIPPDVKKHIMKHPELGNVVCAVVEFEQHESAKKAVAKMTNNDDWRTGLRVVLLAQPKKKNDKNDKKNRSGDADGDSSASRPTDGGSPSQNEDNSPSGDKRKKNKDRKKKKGSRVEELAQMEVESLSSGSEAEGVDSLAGGEPQRRKSSGAGIPSRVSLSPNPELNRLSPSNTPRSSPRNTPRSSPRSSPRGSPNMRRRHHGKSPLATDNLSPGTSPKPSPSASPEMSRRKNSGVELGTSPSGSPWVQRRLKAQQLEGSPLAGRSPGTSPRLGRRLLDLEGVIRQPRGPDGTKGFHGGIGRGKTIVTAEA